MKVKINGNDVELKEGSTIKEAIDFSNAPYDDGSIICLIKGKKEFEKNINKYKIKTPKGSIIIEMVENEEAKPLIDLWKKQYKDFEGRSIRWTSSNEVAIGPTTTDLEPTMDENRYKDGDVILSLSGFSNESTHIIFAKEDHSAVYGVPDFNKGIFAKIVGGKRTVRLLDSDDDVISVEGIIERSSVTDSASVSNLNTVLKEGNQLFTYVMLKIDENSPQSAEHLFSLIEKGNVSVDYEANSFVGFYSLQGLGKSVENTTMRKRGTVTVRNTGKGIGKVYIYREDRVKSHHHTTVAYVEKGMELLDIASSKDKITIKSNPERIMTLAMTQKETEDYLKSIGISHEKIGVIDDDGLVVEQNPEFSIDIIKEGKVTTKGINKEDLAIIEIYDNENEAPRSSWYFKKISGLVEKPIGALKVHFAFPGMKMSIFEGDSKEAKGLIPENIPGACVEAGKIGVTNMAKKNVGLIGVRFESNDEFGPTAEPFNATNIVGKIITDLNHIEELKEGELLYIKRSKE
ncbi:methanogenesis marker 3 protein [Methanobrevibacter sp. TMH8]|uniref:methyl-coenzyme M reductase-associated protein Mmp3 n=1 Tax=Methanobrevibacter sp. TMH8 TaxID=2848611 RepID=UPI001CCA156A|nr:methanogenesis marker 3 protein [Methanobrevibacter sp. TMH8]MBZ9571664.1 methanogenesis marker 3 protein [Methanobrevibacter sp. TMH8]